MPKKFQYIVDIIKKYKPLDPIWTTSFKNIYRILITHNTYLSKIQTDYKYLNWNKIWQTLWSYKNSIDRNILYRHLYSVIPIGNYFTRYGITNKIPKCLMCQNSLYTEKHILQYCKFYDQVRSKLIADIKEIKPDIQIDSVLYKFGNNNTSHNFDDVRIIKLIFDYILHIYQTVQRPSIT